MNAYFLSLVFPTFVVYSLRLAFLVVGVQNQPIILIAVAGSW